jgi:glycosyltransferase involved in cell wall biosynthesis
LEFLKQAARAALSQTYENIELLIGDDGSSPNIRAWCEQQAKTHHRFRYQRNPRNLGLAGNWNALVDSARGDYISIIGDDDRLLPEFVHKTVEVADRGATLVFTNHFVIDENGNRLHERTTALSREYGRESMSPGWVPDSEICAWRNTIPISAALMRTADIRRLRFKEDLNNPELELFVRLAREGGNFFFLPEYLAEYRVHPNSETTSVGLSSDRLARYLIDLSVRPEVEEAKEAYLAPLLVNAVSCCLVMRNPAGAKIFLTSSYYPNSERIRLRGLVQAVCAFTPGIGPPVYRAAARLWRSLRGIRAALPNNLQVDR